MPWGIKFVVPIGVSMRTCVLLSMVAVGLAACGESEVPRAEVPELSAVPQLEASLTPDEAYGVIPHRRTEIDLSDSTLPDHHRRYVELTLSSLDQAIALRVSTLRDVMAGRGDLDVYTREQDRLTQPCRIA